MRYAFLLVLTACVDFSHGGGGTRGNQGTPDAAKVPADAAPDVAADGASLANPVVVQQASGSAAFDTAVITVSPTGAGHLLVIGATGSLDSQSVASVTDDAGASYVATGRANVNGGSAEIWFAPASNAGATQITVKFSNTSGGSVWMLEVAGSNPKTVIVAVHSNMPAGSLIAAPPVTTKGPNTLVFSVLEATGGTLAGLHTGNPFLMMPVMNGDSSAYAIAPTPGPYAAQWDNTGGTGACALSAAFSAL
jgi:hypothetical protein